MFRGQDMSSALSTYDDDAVAEITRHAWAGNPPKAKANAAAAFKPAALSLPAGCRWFSDVFGWKPEHLPRDVPVRVFEAKDWEPEARPYVPGTLPNGGLWDWPRKATELLALAMHA